MSYGIIYKATGPDGKVYVGQTVKTLAMRKGQHAYRTKKGDRRTAFHVALLDEGFDNFQWDEIDIAENQAELDQKEKYWVAHYKADDSQYGYNLQSGGIGARQTEKTKQKLREIFTGKKYGPMPVEIRQKMSEAKKGKPSGMKGKHHTADVRKRISENMKGINTWQKGRKASEETRRKMSEAQKKRWEK